MTSAPQSIHPIAEPSIASIIHELRVSGDPTEGAWAEVIESLRAQYADANADAIRLHHEKMDQYDRAIVAEARVKELEAALREIARQMLVPELIEEYGDEYTGDFEGAYESLIRIARAALTTGQPK